MSRPSSERRRSHKQMRFESLFYCGRPFHGGGGGHILTDELLLFHERSLNLGLIIAQKIGANFFFASNWYGMSGL